MSFPSAWVDQLFAKLTVRYGLAFMRQYEGLDIELVKADWAEVLGGFENRQDAVRYAMSYLPADKPPTAMQFRDICRRAPSADVPRLLPPSVPARPERVREALKRALAGPAERATMTPAQWCALGLRRIAAERGGRLSTVQLQQLAACERQAEMDPSTADMGGFSPIPEHDCPWNREA